MSFKNFAQRAYTNPAPGRVLSREETRRRNAWLLDRMPDIRVGDMVSYNAAGMLHKTLGVVFAVEDDMTSEYRRLSANEGPKILTIQWCVVGKYMPQTALWGGPNAGDIVPGRFYRHRIGSWFRVVNP